MNGHIRLMAISGAKFDQNVTGGDDGAYRVDSDVGA